MPDAANSRPVYVHVTRRGFLACELLRARPQAEWTEIESVVERIAGQGIACNAVELGCFELANAQRFEDPVFPDHVARVR